MHKNIIYHFLALFLMIMWGMSFYAIDVSLREMTPGSLALFRFSLAALLLALINLSFRHSFRLEAKDYPRVAIGGLFGICLYFLFENTAVEYTKISNISVIIATVPIVNLLVERIFFGRHFSLITVLGVVLSFIGIVFIILSNESLSLTDRDFIGNLLVLAAALCWVVYSQTTYRLKGNYHSLIITMYQSFFGSLFLLPFLMTQTHYSFSWSVINALLYLSILCSVLGYFLYVECQKHLGSAVMTTYVNVMPIVGIASGWGLLNETITFWQIFGSIIILTGVYMVSSKRVPQAPKSTANKT